MTQTIIRTFDKGFLKDLAYDDHDDTQWKVIETNLVDTSRWSEIYEQVFQEIETGKFYLTSYSVGATECQDERPYEYDPDEIECHEVEPVEVKVIKYKPIKTGGK